MTREFDYTIRGVISGPMGPAMAGAGCSAVSIRLFCALLVLSACGGGNPAAPTPTPAVCTLDAMQCILDRAFVNLTVNGGAVDVGSTIPVSVGSTYMFRVDYTAISNGQGRHFAFVFTRDDGIERLPGCSGGGGGIAGQESSGGFGSGGSIPSSDAGHTVRVSVVGAFGPLPTPGSGSPCMLRTTTGGLNHAAVQGQRDLLTLRVQ